MQLEHDHSRQAIGARLAQGTRPNYLRDWVYGGIDGAVTTFAIVAGVAGAQLSASVIVVLGLANLLADGFSMAASNYSGTKTEVDDLKRLRQIEKKHIAQAPEGEREEIRQILQNKGMRGATLEEAVRVLTSDEDVWTDVMLAEEYGATTNLRSPIRSGLATFGAFVICGAVPLVPFLVPLTDPFPVASILTAFVFFMIGTAKSRWALTPWWRSGGETLTIGILAAGAAFLVGYSLKGWVGG